MITKEKIWVAFDHGNILYGFNKLSSDRINYITLKEIVLGGRKSEKNIVYTGISPSKGNFSKRKSRNNFYTFLEKNDFEINTIPVKILPNGSYKQKGVDVNLALDCLAYAYEDQYDHLILVSGDGDFAPLVKWLIKLNKTVEVWAFQGSISPRLSKILGYRNLNFLDGEIDKLKLKR